MYKKKWMLLVLVLVLVAVVAGASVLYGHLSGQVDAGPAIQQTESPSMEENAAQAETDAEAELALAPDFTVYDADGNETRLSDLRGKPVVVNFWASWCAPCKSEMPDFEDAVLQYGEEIHFMMVNMTDGSRETVETAKSFVEMEGYTFPVYYDTDYSAAITYGVNTIPASYFIDADGRAVARAAGMLDRETLQVGIDMILPETDS